MVKQLFSKIVRIFYREPDFEVENNDKPYLKRWYIIPRNKRFNIYLHKFMQSDEDRALHDHPWWNISLLLQGCYDEVLPKDDAAWRKHESRETITKRRYPLLPVFRGVNNIHRIQLLHDDEGNERAVWTIFITGPKMRNWGFWCNKGWRAHDDFVDQSEDGKHKTGAGCSGLD